MNQARQGPRIYNLFPTLLGFVARWEERLPAIADMGFDITGFVAAVNRMKAETAVLNEEGPQKRFTVPDALLVGLLRRSAQGSQRAAALINPDPEQGRYFARAELASAMDIHPSAVREITPLHEGASAAGNGRLRLDPRSLRIFLAD